MDEMATSAGYWAVGTDCCKRQGSFHCGDAQSLGCSSWMQFLGVVPVLCGVKVHTLLNPPAV